MSSSQIRLITRYLRKFFTGFVAVIPFTHTRLKGYPFSRPDKALDSDWLDIGNDIEKIK